MTDIHKTMEAMWKIESTRLIAAIARVTRYIGVAEELAQDALVSALEVWPEEGIPKNPAAWPKASATVLQIGVEEGFLPRPVVHG